MYLWHQRVESVFFCLREKVHCCNFIFGFMFSPLRSGMSRQWHVVYLCFLFKGKVCNFFICFLIVGFFVYKGLYFFF